MDEPLELELDTPLESALLVTGCLGVLFGGYLTLMTLIGETPLPAWVGPALLGMGLVGGLLRKLVDECYLLDPRQEKLLFRRRWAGREWLIPVACYRDFLAFGVQGRFQSSKSESWWEYFPVLITRDKRVYAVGDPLKEEPGFEMVSEKAQVLAELTGTPLHPPEPQRILKAVAPGPTLIYVPHRTPWLLVGVIILVSVLAGLGLAWYGSQG